MALRFKHTKNRSIYGMLIQLHGTTPVRRAACNSGTASPRAIAASKQMTPRKIHNLIRRSGGLCSISLLGLLITPSEPRYSNVSSFENLEMPRCKLWSCLNQKLSYTLSNTIVDPSCSLSNNDSCWDRELIVKQSPETSLCKEQTPQNAHHYKKTVINQFTTQCPRTYCTRHASSLSNFELLKNPAMCSNIEYKASLLKFHVVLHSCSFSLGCHISTMSELGNSSQYVPSSSTTKTFKTALFYFEQSHRYGLMQYPHLPSYFAFSRNSLAPQLRQKRYTVQSLFCCRQFFLNIPIFQKTMNGKRSDQALSALYEPPLVRISKV